VWEFIKKYNLPYPKLYDEGFDRLGCIVCPFHSSKKEIIHNKYKQKWPKYFKLFEKQVGITYQKRKNQGKTMYYDTPEEFVKEWYKNSMAKWYEGKKTKT